MRTLTSFIWDGVTLPIRAIVAVLCGLAVALTSWVLYHKAVAEKDSDTFILVVSSYGIVLWHLIQG